MPPTYEPPKFTESAQAERITVRPQKIENYVRSYYGMRGLGGVRLGQPSQVQQGAGAPVAAAKKIAEYIADAEMSGMTLFDAFVQFSVDSAPGFVKNTWPVNEAEVAGALAIFASEYAGKPG